MYGNHDTVDANTWYTRTLLLVVVVVVNYWSIEWESFVSWGKNIITL